MSVCLDARNAIIAVLHDPELHIGFEDREALYDTLGILAELDESV